MTTDTDNVPLGLLTNLQTLAKLTPEKLRMSASPGTPNYGQSAGYAIVAIDVAKALLDVKIGIFSEEVLAELAKLTEDLCNALSDAQRFQLTGRPDDARTLKYNGQRMEQTSRKFCDTAMPLATFAAFRSGLNQDAIKEHMTAFRTSAQQVLNTANAALKDAEAVTQRVEDAHRIMTETLKGITISEHAQHFETAETNHNRSARNWLIAACVLAVITIGAAFVLLVWKAPQATEWGPQFVSDMVLRVFVLSLLLSATVAASRNYRSHRHLSVVNGQRARALRTFAAFNEAAEEAVRPEVLLAAVNATFAPTVSGYLGGDEALPANTLLGLLGNVTRSRGGG